jgi:hypothetical protein
VLPPVITPPTTRPSLTPYRGSETRMTSEERRDLDRVRGEPLRWQATPGADHPGRSVRCHRLQPCPERGSVNGLAASPTRRCCRSNVR